MQPLIRAWGIADAARAARMNDFRRYALKTAHPWHQTNNYRFGGLASRTIAPSVSLITSTANRATLSSSLVLSDA